MPTNRNQDLDVDQSHSISLYSLNKLLCTMEMYESRGETYDPSEDGFVFAKAQIDQAILARGRVAHAHGVPRRGSSRRLFRPRHKRMAFPKALLGVFGASTVGSPSAKYTGTNVPLRRKSI